MTKKILLIDDEELITRTLARALEKSGYDVLTAKRGEDAIVMAEEEEFDLIISDIRMPGVGGVAVVRQIFDARRTSGGTRIPVIFITGYADETAEKQAKEIDAAAYIEKPFDLEPFLAQVRTVLEGKPRTAPRNSP